MIKTFRAQAEQQLMAFGFDVAENQKAEHEQSAMMARLDIVRLELLKEIQRRTSWVGALITNVGAWLIALAITVLVVTAWNKPDPAKLVVDQAKIAEDAATRAVQKALSASERVADGKPANGGKH